MTPKEADVSFYFFDFDDNVMRLETPIFLINTVTNEELPVSTREFASVHPRLGEPGDWEDHGVNEASFRGFRDLPPDALGDGAEQPFVRDLRRALDGPPGDWQGPSWIYFAHACARRRPMSIVTARGHHPDTIKRGIGLLVEAGHIPCEPRYHTVYPVSNADVRRQLGDKRMIMTTPALKKHAIIRSVDLALEKHGDAHAHRFGMSDDDPGNVQMVISAMRRCKQNHPDKRFFVINTHPKQEVKLEVFPIDYPVTSIARAPGSEYLG